MPRNGNSTSVADSTNEISQANMITTNTNEDVTTSNKDEEDFYTAKKDKDVPHSMVLNKRRKIDLTLEKTIVIDEDEAAKCPKKLTQKKLCFIPSFKPQESIESSSTEQYTFEKIIRTNLKLKYYRRIFSRTTADKMFEALEKQIAYCTSEKTKVKVFGKWHDIPRKQAAYGDDGTSYTFSGNCLPSQPWSKCPIIQEIKERIESICQCNFNFVLVNRYKDGKDHMGEHRDDEKDLVPHAPIASVSFGQVRDFVFKHRDTRKKLGDSQKMKSSNIIPPITVPLEHGSLLVMEYPTNKFWYHSLPVRANAKNVRINLTFRQMVVRH